MAIIIIIIINFVKWQGTQKAKNPVQGGPQHTKLQHTQNTKQ